MEAALGMKKMLIIGLLAVAITAVLGNLYLGQKVLALSKENAQKDDTQQLLADVGNLVELPLGIPTIATVDDPEALKKQGLFPTALKGDIVLVYAVEKRAILYRPSTKKIIDISVVNITEEPPAAPAAAPAPAPAPAPTPAPIGSTEASTPTTP